jgi:two-component system NtrC family sensor kinase
MKPTALIVDDSLTVRMDLTHAFEAAGFQPIGCATAAEARTALAQAPVDVTILDVVLPDGDGVDLLAEMRGHADTADAIILMLSTEAEVNDRIRGLQTGADEYVGKPYDTGYVIAKARQLMRSRVSARRPSDIDSTLVLVIDDSLAVRQELTTTLEAAGYTVLTADTGEDGLRLASDRRPDAVIIGGTLPRVDGPTIVRRLRLDATLRGIPCLLLTATSDRTAELQALDAGADAFVHLGDTAVILAKLAAALNSTTSPAISNDTGSLLGPKKLLVIGDGSASMDTLAGTLHGEGFDVVLARSGAEALTLLGTQPVDCVLLHDRAPEAGGPETCRRIKATPSVQGVPVIVITERGDPAATVEGIAAGADDVLHEFDDVDILKAHIRSQVRRKQLDEENRRIADELLRRELAAADARAAQQLAETRAALAEELERRNEELEAFSYSVSHDLRSPLNTIIGFNQLLLDDRDDGLDEQTRECVHVTLNAAWRMAELIEDLLQLAYVSRGELTREQVDLSGVAHGVVHDLRRRDPARQVTTLIEDGVTADADGRLVRVLFDNLIGNAWKYTAKTDEARIEFGQQLSSDPATYFIRDNGAGFDMAQADKLFRPFTRLHSPEQFPGTGIGLATVRRIVDRHNGRIWADAAVGHGATFYFSLPTPTSELATNASDNDSPTARQ